MKRDQIIKRFIKAMNKDHSFCRRLKNSALDYRRRTNERF